MASGDEQQRRRRRLLGESNDPNPAAVQGQDAGISSHRFNEGSQHPLSTATTAQQQDITSTIHYLTDMLRPQRVKQQKQLPKLCMIHQLYSLVADHTAVDRALVRRRLQPRWRCKVEWFVDATKILNFFFKNFRHIRSKLDRFASSTLVVQDPMSLPSC